MSAPAAAPVVSSAGFDLPRRRALGLAAAMVGTAGLTWIMRPVAGQGSLLQIKLDDLVPRRFGAWQADPNAEALVRAPTQGGKAYGLYDQVLERVYVHDSGTRMMLSIAYGAEQSPGMQAHRPEVCYPSAGYVVERLQRTDMPLPAGSMPVTQLHARMGQRSEPVTYWIVLGNEVVRDALAFRLRQISSGLRRRILDGLLVRISSLDEDATRAWQAQRSFAEELQRAVDPAGRAHLFGEPQRAPS